LKIFFVVTPFDKISLDGPFILKGLGGIGMPKEQQLENYRETLRELEAMPPSPHRDWLVSLVREQIEALEKSEKFPVHL
jgi:hypothetical protein